MTAIDCRSWKFASALPCTSAVYFCTLIIAVVTIAIATANTIIATSVSVSVKPLSSRRSRLRVRRLSIKGRRVGSLGHAGAEIDRHRERRGLYAVHRDRVEDRRRQRAGRRRRCGARLALAGRIRWGHAAEGGRAGCERAGHRDLARMSAAVERGSERRQVDG